MADIVERLRTTVKDMLAWNGPAMTAWDTWRSAIADGEKGSWPRDAYESHLDSYAEQLTEAADLITALRAEVERLRGFETANRLNAAQVKAQRAEVERVNAENEKLRAALKTARPFIGWAGHYPTILAEVDAALEGKQ